MEYFEGSTIDVFIANVSGPIVKERLIKLFIQILDAFEYVHNMGIIHRDIKPSNIMVDNNYKTKIIDFGIGKRLEETQIYTKVETQMGTIPYMSPEQVAASKNINHLTDIYSLGVTLYEMATAECPYDLNEIGEFAAYKLITNEPLPRASKIFPDAKIFEDIIDKATAKNKEDRFQSCAEFKKALLNIDTDALIKSKPKATRKSVIKEPSAASSVSSNKTVFKEPKGFAYNKDIEEDTTPKPKFLNKKLIAGLVFLAIMISSLTLLLIPSPNNDYMMFKKISHNNIDYNVFIAKDGAKDNLSNNFQIHNNNKNVSHNNLVKYLRTYRDSHKINSVSFLYNDLLKSSLPIDSLFAKGLVKPQNNNCEMTDHFPQPDPRESFFYFEKQYGTGALISVHRLGDAHKVRNIHNHTAT